MTMGRLVTVLVITNVGDAEKADEFIVSVSVGRWETGGDIDGYEEASGDIDGCGNLLVVSDGGIDGDVGRF